MAPPEPLERVLAALDRRRRGQRVRLLLHREPYPLYTLLGQMRMAYKVQAMRDGEFEILNYDPTDVST